jgi:hypothetical protein
VQVLKKEDVMLRNRNAFGIVVLLAAMLVSMACSLSSVLPDLGGEDATATPEVAVLVPTGAPIPTNPPAATEAPMATAAATAVKPTTPPTGTAQPAPTGAAPQTQDMQTGLDKLDSYRMNYTMTVTGKNAKGVDAKQEIKLLQETIKSKESMRTSWSGTGMSADKNASIFDIYQIGKTGYMMTAAVGTTKASCMSFSSDKPAFDQKALLTPDELLAGLQSDALVARGEMMNGVKTDHYKLKKANLGFGVATSQTGELWVAQEGGFLVKFLGQAEGDFSLTADKVKGTVTWDYNLTEVNKLKDIVLPPECTASTQAIADLPIPPNAVEKNTFGEIITFNSPDAPKVVADFFRKELPAQGWKITSDTNLGTVVMMSIQKDTRKFSIMITPGQNDKGTAVVISKGQ